jgi:oligopeptide/dipeptide ABC transporter ATP-binding protein
MIFQDPGSSFNPVLTVGRQIAEAVRVHDRSLSRAAVRARVLELLREVHITDPEARMGQFPHEFSGGMLQRAMIAMAMVNRPRLVIADEITTALDVTIQAQILQLLDRLRRESGSSVVLVTHDLGVVAEIADRVVVMYAGSVVESAPVDQIFTAPRHPYTAGLLASRPQTSTKLGRLYSIPGQPPVVQGPVHGCLFEPRCPIGREQATCRESVPPLVAYAPDHDAACHFSDQVHPIGAGDE